MIVGYSPVMQALLGTLFTWGLTAAGSGLVFFMQGTKPRILDSSLGFAAGVMTAASFWSLLAPAIEMAEESKLYGSTGEYAFIPVACGFLLGGAFVFLADHLMDGSSQTSLLLCHKQDIRAMGNGKKDDDFRPKYSNSGEMKQRVSSPVSYSSLDQDSEEAGLPGGQRAFSHQQWKRILLLIVAITVHNIPEGLAVGVGFGAVSQSRLATFIKAKNLAIGIGIQNFPEGMAVSLPLRAAGYSKWTAFWYGQLSGMVEPVAGVLGAAMVSLWQPLLPWALAFAAGAMICVVVDDLIPEAHSRNNGRLSSYWCLLGFVVMMALDVGLG
ncbi:zinc transporter ZIP11 isoform X2 [Hyalella azteca]|uniref:Zinc transporter ZIP11 n=1 Tax=Hyalella azteca TaxID=294128 RepID=A0A8B7NHW1_HYAAZ|nr:zinc transporter ZIP11 isoform X2 [Hyalella azteca]